VMTRDTVETETPDRSATSRIVAILSSCEGFSASQPVIFRGLCRSMPGKR